MNEKYKKILEKQLTLLSERSAKISKFVPNDSSELQGITETMIQLVKILDSELRSQLFAEELSNLPSATLKISDLEEIAAARKARGRRFEAHLLQIQKEVEVPHSL